MDCASCSYWHKNDELKRELEKVKSDLTVYKTALEMLEENENDRDYFLELAIKKCVQEGRFKK